MIQVTRLNGTPLWLNPVLIEVIEATPDTIVTLTNGHKYVLSDTPEGIRDAIVEFMQHIGLIGTSRGKDDLGE